MQKELMTLWDMKSTTKPKRRMPKRRLTRPTKRAKVLAPVKPGFVKHKATLNKIHEQKHIASFYLGMEKTYEQKQANKPIHQVLCDLEIDNREKNRNQQHQKKTTKTLQEALVLSQQVHCIQGLTSQETDQGRRSNLKLSQCT